MALSKPILSSVPAWDVGNGQNFSFSVLGGDIVIQNSGYQYLSNTLGLF